MRVVVSFLGTGCGDRVVHELCLRRLRNDRPGIEMFGLDDRSPLPLEEFRLPLDEIVQIAPPALAEFREDVTPGDQEAMIERLRGHLADLLQQLRADELVFFLGDPWVLRALPREGTALSVHRGWSLLEIWRRQGEYPRFPVTPEEREQARRLLPFPPGRPLLAVHLRNRGYRARSNLPLDKYGTLIQALQQDANIVLLGTPGESPGLASPSILDLTSRARPLTVGQLAGVLGEATVFLGGETFLTHLACACGRPVVACEYSAAHGPLVPDDDRTVFWSEPAVPIDVIAEAVRRRLLRFRRQG